MIRFLPEKQSCIKLSKQTNESCALAEVQKLKRLNISIIGLHTIQEFIWDVTKCRKLKALCIYLFFCRNIFHNGEVLLTPSVESDLLNSLAEIFASF